MAIYNASMQEVEEYHRRRYERLTAMKQDFRDSMSDIADEFWSLWLEDYGDGRGQVLLNTVREIFQEKVAENGYATTPAPSPRKSRSRPKLSARKSLSVFARNGYACIACGSQDDLTVDHIVPWSKGGTNDMDNLQTLCRSCNSRKGAR